MVIGHLFLLGVVFAQPGAVNGFVRDASDGEPLSYANVYLEGTDLGAPTNHRGYYYIGSVRPGEYDLTASFVGYGSAHRKITVSANQTLTVNLDLKPGAVELGEVKVTAERARFEREVEISATRLETKQLALAPRVGGEQDLFRTVQLLPGVVTTSDFSNRLYIRGGSPDQNLILLDGISVYNPSHLFGLFSPFITDAVSDVTLLAGGFPAKYGGRLSSVLDVTTKEGNSRRYTGNGSVSLIAAQTQAEGPLPFGRMTNDQSPMTNPDSSPSPSPSPLKGEGIEGRGRPGTEEESAESADENNPSSRGSFLVAGRRTYLPDLLLTAFDIQGLGYYFYDLVGKVNYDFTQDSRLTVSGLGAEDVLSFWDPENRSALDSKMRWGNRGVSARWNRVFTPVLYGEVMGAWSNFHSRFDVSLGDGQQAQLSTDLTDLTLKADMTWYLADRHTLDLGLDAKYVGISAGFSYDTLTVVPRDTLVPAAVYVDEKWELIPERLFLKPGLRLAYESKGSRFAPEPRLGVKYRPAENTALSAALGRFTQPMVTLNSTDAVLSIYDVWLPVPRARRLPSALHFITGVEQWLARDAIAEFEVYYKDYSDLLEVRYGSFFTQPESLLVADGYSYGADLSLRKTEGRVNGWVNYSFMWTRRNIGEEVFHPHYDRRHSANVVVNFPALFWGADLSAKWTLGTGLPFAGALGYYPRYEYIPQERRTRLVWKYIEGTRDAVRYPVYHRLDASLTKTWHKRWSEISLFLDVANLYNAANVLLYYWDNETEGQPPVRKQIGMLPILPTLGVKVRF